MGFLDFIDPGNSGGSVPSQSSPWDGLGPSPAVVYRCSVCSASYLNKDQLFEHRFSEHPFKRPALILAGRELTSPRELLSQPLIMSQVILANTDHCVFDSKPVETAKLPYVLSQQRTGLHTIVLDRLGIETRYELLFEIADVRELEEQENCFIRSILDILIDGKAHPLIRTLKCFITPLVVCAIALAITRYVGAQAKFCSGHSIVTTDKYHDAWIWPSFKRFSNRPHWIGKG